MGGKLLSNPYFRAKPKFENNVKCYEEKSFEKIFDTQKNIFFSGHFFGKNFFSILKKCLSLKNFPNFFLKFFPKKCPEKNCFECQKTF